MIDSVRGFGGRARTVPKSERKGILLSSTVTNEGVAWRGVPGGVPYIHRCFVVFRSALITFYTKEQPLCRVRGGSGGGGGCGDGGGGGGGSSIRCAAGSVQLVISLTTYNIATLRRRRTADVCSAAAIVFIRVFYQSVLLLNYFFFHRWFCVFR